MNEHDIARWISDMRTPGGLSPVVPAVAVRIYDVRPGTKLALIYNGWLVGAAVKRDGATRIIVEDAGGRLRIHAPDAATEIEP